MLFLLQEIGHLRILLLLLELVIDWKVMPVGGCSMTVEDGLRRLPRETDDGGKTIYIIEGVFEPLFTQRVAWIPATPLSVKFSLQLTLFDYFFLAIHLLLGFPDLLLLEVPFFQDAISRHFCTYAGCRNHRVNVICLRLANYFGAWLEVLFCVLQ